MPVSGISQVPIHAIGAPPLRHAGFGFDVAPAKRWNCCRITEDVAHALQIPHDGLSTSHRLYQVRICVTQADVNVLYNPGYIDFLGKSESFVVEAITGGSQRVEIYANSGPGARDGGVFKLYGGGNPFAGTHVPTNARVSLCRDELCRTAAAV